MRHELIERSWGFAVGFSDAKNMKKINAKNFKIITAETPFGKVLAIEENGRIALQTSQLYNIYDEVMALAPIMIAKRVGNVLILGGGDLAIASIIKEKVPYARITVVDVEKRVSEAMKGVFDAKVNFIEEDAYAFVFSTKDKYDIIIGDLTDPEDKSISSKLYSREFLSKVKEIMSNEAILIIQSGSPIFQKWLQKKVKELLSEIFGTYKSLWFPVPIYPGGIWTAYLVDLSQEYKIKREVEGKYIINKRVLSALMEEIPLVR